MCFCSKRELLTKMKKLYVDAYAKNMDEIYAELLNVDKEIKTKNDRFIQALKDIKIKIKD